MYIYIYKLLYVFVLEAHAGYENLLGEDDFKNALYIIDIGQNDLTRAFNELPDDKAVERIPPSISEIKDAMRVTFNFASLIMLMHLHIYLNID